MTTEQKYRIVAALGLTKDEFEGLNAYVNKAPVPSPAMDLKQFKAWVKQIKEKDLPFDLTGLECIPVKMSKPVYMVRPDTYCILPFIVPALNSLFWGLVVNDVTIARYDSYMNVEEAEDYATEFGLRLLTCEEWEEKICPNWDALQLAFTEIKRISGGKMIDGAKGYWTTDKSGNYTEFNTYHRSAMYWDKYQNRQKHCRFTLGKKTKLLTPNYDNWEEIKP